MSRNYDTGGSKPKAPRALRDVLTSLLCLLTLTLAGALMLNQVGIGRIAHPARFGTSDDKNLDALLTAIELNDVPAVRRLLRKRGVDVNAANRHGVLPIIHALQGRGRALEMVDLLLAAGADVNSRGPNRRAPALLHCATLRRPDLVERLLRAGADPNARHDNGWTALHHAAIGNDAETAAVLLAAGADPVAADDEGHTPLDIASAYGSRATATALRAAPPQRKRLPM